MATKFCNLLVIQNSKYPVRVPVVVVKVWWMRFTVITPLCRMMRDQSKAHAYVVRKTLPKTNPGARFAENHSLRDRLRIAKFFSSNSVDGVTIRTWRVLFRRAFKTERRLGCLATRNEEGQRTMSFCQCRITMFMVTHVVYRMMSCLRHLSYLSRHPSISPFLLNMSLT